MKTTEKNITITRGDSFGFNFEVADDKGVATTLDACFFSCKRGFDDDRYVFQKSLGDGITALQDGGYYVKISPADTQSLARTSYLYDLQVQIGDDIYTPLKGRLNIEWDVTEAEEN